MPGKRVVQGGSILILLAVATTAATAQQVSMVSPTEQDILFGETQFQFDVAPGPSPIDRIDVYVGGRLIGSAAPPEWSFRWHAPQDLEDKRVLAVAFARGAAVEKLSVEPRPIAIHQDVEVALVQIFPVVFDRRGRYVHDLPGESFEVFDQGRPVRLKHFSVEAVSSTVALLIDTSKSMTDKLVVVQDASCGFVEKLGDRHDLSLYAFNHTTMPLLERVRDPQEMQTAVRSLRAGGGTALYDGLLLVLQRLREVDGRRVVVVFSDGRDERSLATRDLVVREARKSGVLIYAVGTVRGNGPERARDELRELAEATGGQPFFITRAADLGAAFHDVLRDLESQYVLSYPVPPGPPGPRTVDVRVRDKGYRVRFRPEYHVD